MSMLHQLLFIKDFHKKKAEMTLLKARMLLQEAQRQEQKAQETLQSFQTEAERAERAWFEALCSRVVKVRDIHNVHADVAQLRATEQMHVQNWQQAQKEHTQASASHKQATSEKKEADQVCEKFVELVHRHEQMQANEAERKEELELEELNGNLRPQAEPETV
jgi:Type III secretion protein YscO